MFLVPGLSTEKLGQSMIVKKGRDFKLISNQTILQPIALKTKC
jgi:hypothetical protein